MDIITMDHGSGGKKTYDLINNIFYKYFNNDILLQQGDSSILKNINERLAVTTDSFIIKPIFFPGGDIGKLSICGTVNDLAVVGAKPKYITVGFIIEEGLNIKTLKTIVKSMAKEAGEIGVKIIAGDTKVVERGSGDKIFINTTGIGIIEENHRLLGCNNIIKGDKVIINGTVGDHGMCIFNEREALVFDVDIKSDCSSLNGLIKDILDVSDNIKVMRDPTRGGLGTTLNEITQASNKSIVLNERDIPIKDEVNSMGEMLGFDPLYMANEGKVIVIVSDDDAKKVLEEMRKNPLGKDSKIIGEVIDDNRSRVYLKTKIAGTRILNMLEGELVPRIC